MEHCGTYEIWDIDSGNLFGSFETEAEAIALVAEFGRGADRRNAVRHLMLGWNGSNGEGGEIAIGDDLLVLAGANTPLAS
jgi:hypothetical protein